MRGAFSLPQSVLALLNPDPRMGQCSASQSYPKHSKEGKRKFTALLLPACSPSANVLKIYGVTIEKNDAVNNSEAQRTFECAVFPAYIAQFYMHV